MKNPTKSETRRKNLVVINVLFGLWIMLLMIGTIMNSFSPVFYDALLQVDVSGDYHLSYPLVRVIFEPFIGLHHTIGLEFDSWTGVFLWLYLICRFLMMILDQISGKHKRNCPFISWLKNSSGFAFKWGGRIFFIGILILASGFGLRGYLFVTNNYNWVLRGIAWSWVLIFFVKMGHNWYDFIKEKGDITLKKYYSKNKLISKIKNATIQKSLSITKRELLQFIQVFCLILMFNQAVLTIRLPTQQISTDLEEGEYLFDFHVHTLLSDGSLSPTQRVEWYIDQGIQGAAFSDHHHPEGSLQAQKYVEKKGLDFTVFLSQEFTDDPEDIHLNIWGIDEPLIPTGYDPLDRVENTMTCQEVIQWVKARGGYVTVNHYSGNGGIPFTYEQLRDWGVDGFEIINDGRERAGDIRQFCLDNDLICMAGSDDHTNGPLNTLVKLRLDDPNNRTLDAVFEALYRNDHETVLIRNSPSRSDLSKEGWERLADYFLGLSLSQIISWYAWTAALIITANIIQVKMRKKGRR